MNKPKQRIEDDRFLRGAGFYSDDITLPGAAFAVFVRSPHAHADIVSIDTKDACALPGVVSVITGADLVAAGLGKIKPMVNRPRDDGRPMWVPPRWPLATGSAHFVGDPVAMVIAETQSAAMDAAEAVTIEWAPLPAVLDIEEAMAPDAPRVWSDLPDNACFHWSAGDDAASQRAFAEAAHVTTLKVPVSRVSANAMEPRAAIAAYDAAADRFTLTTGLQSPWQVRKILSEQVLAIAPEKLRVISPDVGGSFGMKGQTYCEYGALLYAAKVLDRPVKWTATRSESLLTDDHGRDVVMTGSLALDADGRILAIRVEGLTALGAYLSTRGTNTAVANILGIAGVYRVPAMFVRLVGVHTNTGSISPYRGAGRPEASLLIERLMDVAADETGRDPVELRLTNTLTSDELPYSNPLGFVYDSGDFHGTLARALQIGDRDGFAERRAASEAAGRLRGFGIANVIARAMDGRFESARASLRPDGQIGLAVGSVSHGQGHATVFSDLAAAILDVVRETIVYESGDSDLFENAVGTFGSRTAGIGGAAVDQAVRVLRERLLGAAGQQLNCGPGDVVFSGGVFTSPQGSSLSLAELAARTDTSLSAEAIYTPDAPTYPNGCHVCEVEIDRQTGVPTIARYIVVEDVGTVLNHMIVDGQIHGGVAQGVGQALWENVVYEADSGQMLTGAFTDYVMPRADDLPFFDVESRPCPTTVNPLGVKGGGEGGTIGALPALQNAIADALRPFGVRDMPMPASAEALWQLMNGGDL